MTPQEMARIAYDEFGIVADDKKIIGFANRILASHLVKYAYPTGNYASPERGQGVSDNPYCNDPDNNDPASRATRWHNEVLVQIHEDEKGIKPGSVPEQAHEWLYEDAIDQWRGIREGGTPDEYRMRGFKVRQAFSHPVVGGNEYIRFDFATADGLEDSKVITHDEMRQRYADLRAGRPEQAVDGVIVRASDVTPAKTSTIPELDLRGVPESIYLNLGDVDHTDLEGYDFSRLEGITWNDTAIDNLDIEFVRRDLISTVASEPHHDNG